MSYIDNVHVVFIEVNNQDNEHQQYVCTFLNRQIGMIVWHDNIESYVFVPQSNSLGYMTANALLDIHIQLFSLMKERILS
jgi:hypothetical protein